MFYMFTWLHVEAYFEHLNLHQAISRLYKQAAKENLKITLSLEQLALLVAGTMWMSVSSHTCPSESNSILMMARTGGRLVAIATVHYLKEILLCCGGVCEGHQSDQM